MPYETDFDAAFTTLLGKAQGRITPISPSPTPGPGTGGTGSITPTNNAASVYMNFDGAGQVLLAGMGGIPTLPTGAFTIVGCHMAAGIWNARDLLLSPMSVSASVDIRIASTGQWGGFSRPLYGTTRPTMTNQSEAFISTVGWITQLQPGDMLAYVLTSFSGTATVMTLTLLLNRIDVIGISAPPVVDQNGVQLVDANGNPIVDRV